MREGEKREGGREGEREGERRGEVQCVKRNTHTIYIIIVP